MFYCPCLIILPYRSCLFLFFFYDLVVGHVPVPHVRFYCMLNIVGAKFLELSILLYSFKECSSLSLQTLNLLLVHLDHVMTFVQEFEDSSKGSIILNCSLSGVWVVFLSSRNQTCFLSLVSYFIYFVQLYCSIFISWVLQQAGRSDTHYSGPDV